MNNIHTQTDEACIRCAIPTTPCQRVSQRPGSIPCTLADLENPETIQRLRDVLNVPAFVRELQKMSQEIIESELEP